MIQKEFRERIIGVIPARMNSTRFPGKVLVPIDGIPMVAKVYYQARKAELLDDLMIATDSTRVYNQIMNLDIPIVMTASTHNSGTDRVAEIAETGDAGFYVNIQGDEPFIDPVVIDEVIAQLIKDANLKMGTAATSNLREDEIHDPGVVKVTIDENGFAKDFFRTLPEKGLSSKVFKHIGIYAFEREFLLKFSKMPISSNEKKLNLEQMRAIDNGIPMKTVITNYNGFGIDTKDDLQRALEKLENA